MSDDKNVEGYIHWVIEIVNAFRDVSGMLEESEVIRKTMVELPKSCKPKKYAIDESHDMNKYILD